MNLEVIIGRIIVLLDLVLHPTPYMFYKVSIGRIAWPFNVQYLAFFSRFLVFILDSGKMRYLASIQNSCQS
jgi:hypothetical protein